MVTKIKPSRQEALRYRLVLAHKHIAASAGDQEEVQLAGQPLYLITGILEA